VAVNYPKLNQFLDYRTFLIAHAQEQKRRNPQWSYGAWAKRLGLGGTATITRIIHGDRHPGPKLVDKLVQYFGFAPREAEYFRDLVQLDKLRSDPKMSALLMERLGKKYSNDLKKNVDEKTFQTISNWYFLTIREMVRLQNFKLDPTWISSMLRFKVNARQVTHALQILQDLGLISATENNQVEQLEGRLDTTNDVASEAIKRYHEEMLENARSALRSVPPEEREVSSQTLAINSANLSKAKALIREFQDKFAELLEEEKGDQVYQFQLQLFPLTHRVQSHHTPYGDHSHELTH
jgi:uncharacterized protein (TIGR02147 family)